MDEDPPHLYKIPLPIYKAAKKPKICPICGEHFKKGYKYERADSQTKDDLAKQYSKYVSATFQICKRCYEEDKKHTFLDNWQWYSMFIGIVLFIISLCIINIILYGTGSNAIFAGIFPGCEVVLIIGIVLCIVIPAYIFKIKLKNFDDRYTTTYNLDVKLESFDGEASVYVRNHDFFKKIVPKGSKYYVEKKE